MKIDFARESAVKILYQVEEKGAYSNIVLDEYINKNRKKLKEKDIGFISELVYGTVMWKLTIEAILQMHSNIKLKKISKWIRIILEIGIYQILFLDKVPTSAAVNESVNLAKKYGAKSAGFVNAILRKVSPKDKEKILSGKKEKERISLSYSMPLWIIEELVKQYPMKKVEEICMESVQRPKTTIRINSLKITKEELIEKWIEEKIPYQETKMQDFLHVKTKNLANLDLFQKGYFSVQDMSAGLPSLYLNPKPGDLVLDACSAPGGKTTYLAEIMKNKGKIIAWDIYEHRLELVKQKAKQLGISIIYVEKQDAMEYKKEYQETFDKILLDVPCMGLGVIKRKPDIKWKRTKEDLKEIRKNTKGNIRKLFKIFKKRRKTGIFYLQYFKRRK